jgi:hypothetical protein
MVRCTNISRQCGTLTIVIPDIPRLKNERMCLLHADSLGLEGFKRSTR